MARASAESRPEEASPRPPSIGPPSVPYVPPPPVEEVARLARIRFRQRGRKGGRLVLIGGILYLLAVPITLLWIRAVVEGLLGGVIGLENLLEEVQSMGYMSVLVGLVLGETGLAVGSIAGAYMILSERPSASLAMVPLGAIGAAVSVGYMGWLYGLLGLAAGILVACGGFFAIPRPLPGERLSAYAALGRGR